MTVSYDRRYSYVPIDNYIVTTTARIIPWDRVTEIIIISPDDEHAVINTLKNVEDTCFRIGIADGTVEDVSLEKAREIMGWNEHFNLMTLSQVVSVWDKKRNQWNKGK